MPILWDRVQAGALDSQVLLLEVPSSGPQKGRGMKPQFTLSQFQDAVARAENLRWMQVGREVVGIAACVAKLISAERQKALHILAAADRAPAELQG